MTLALRDIPMKLAVGVLVLVLNGLGVMFGIAALVDEQEALVGQLAKARQQVPAANSRTQQVRHDVDEAAKLSPRYQAIMASGFVGTQDRLAVLKRIEELGGGLPWRDSSYRIAPEKTSQVQIGGQPRTMIASEIELRNGALLDRDILAFWAQVLEDLPGRAATLKATLTRTGDVNAAMLARLRKGEPATLVNGSINIEWLTLQPRAARP